MIRYKDKVFDEYFIDPETAVITDKNGNIQHITRVHGRPVFKHMQVHRIQAYTAWGDYDSSIFDVHHLDDNKMNNSLSNLKLVEHDIHSSISNTGKPKSEAHKAKLRLVVRSDETKKLLSEKAKERCKNDVSYLTNVRKMHEVVDGSKWWNNGVKSVMSKECPGPNFKLGRLVAGKKWWNNGAEEKFKLECPGQNWQLGRLKRRISS